MGRGTIKFEIFQLGNTISVSSQGWNDWSIVFG